MLARNLTMQKTNRFSVFVLSVLAPVPCAADGISGGLRGMNEAVEELHRIAPALVAVGIFVAALICCALYRRFQKKWIWVTLPLIAMVAIVVALFAYLSWAW